MFGHSRGVSFRGLAGITYALITRAQLSLAECSAMQSQKGLDKLKTRMRNRISNPQIVLRVGTLWLALNQPMAKARHCNLDAVRTVYRFLSQFGYFGKIRSRLRGGACQIALDPFGTHDLDHQGLVEAGTREFVPSICFGFCILLSVDRMAMNDADVSTSGIGQGWVGS